MEREDDKLFKRDICCFDFRSNFLVLILFCSILEKKDDKSFERDIIVWISFLILFFVSTSFLVNIGKEMSFPGFRTKQIELIFFHNSKSYQDRNMIHTMMIKSVCKYYIAALLTN